MTRLVYHANDSAPQQLSPFVESLKVIAEDADLCICSPNVNLALLTSITSTAQDWRLLTDMEELLRNTTASQRSAAIKFLVDHSARVRHLPHLRAKVVASHDEALVGSANFTERGMGTLHEMAVHIDDPEVVTELRGWFETLWSQCSSPDAKTLADFSSSLPLSTPGLPETRLPSSAPRVSAAVYPPVKMRAEDLFENDQMAARLARGVSREWMDAYLDMCADLLRTLEIPNEDQRLVMSVPATNVLPITINQRYVLGAFHRGKKTITLMLPAGLKVPSELVPAMRKVRGELGTFGVWPDETPADVPRLGYFKVDHPSELAPLRDAWLLAVTREMQRPWRRSTFRKHHCNSFHRAAMEPDFRAGLLEMAFPSNGRSAMKSA